MSKRYMPEEKTSTIQLLSENCGNIQLTSHRTGIPSRTLYTWWNEEQARLRQLPQEKSELSPPPLQIPYTADNPQDAADLRFDSVMDKVMAQLLEQAQMLSQRFTQNYELIQAFEKRRDSAP